MTPGYGGRRGRSLPALPSPPARAGRPPFALYLDLSTRYCVRCKGRPPRRRKAQRAMPDRVTEVLTAALKQALADHPAEQRLYKSGKLEGLFPGRGGAGGEAAARAL